MRVMSVAAPGVAASNAALSALKAPRLPLWTCISSINAFKYSLRCSRTALSSALPAFAPRNTPVINMLSKFSKMPLAINSCDERNAKARS